VMKMVIMIIAIMLMVMLMMILMMIILESVYEHALPYNSYVSILTSTIIHLGTYLVYWQHICINTVNIDSYYCCKFIVIATKYCTVY
jgi:hypothetical protein